MILGMISTGVMVKLGKVYENMMINLKPSNLKLKRRMIGIVTEITGCDEKTAETLLDKNSWSIPAAAENFRSRN